MQNAFSEIETLIHDFVARLVEAVEAQARQRIQDAVVATLGASASPLAPPVRTDRAPAQPQKTGAPVSDARRLQGQYLGALRRLKGAERIRLQQVAREQGVAAAVRLAMTLR